MEREETARKLAEKVENDRLKKMEDEAVVKAVADFKKMMNHVLGKFKETSPNPDKLEN